MTADFLPMNRHDMQARGWENVDFAYVCGDAYVDHPSFGMAIITRLLEAKGFKVGVIAQPDWKDDASIAVFGRPRLGFLVSAGNMDSMVNHFTVARKRRHDDAYTPGGEWGKRPDRAAVVYGNLIRRTYKDVPIILGGIEASLRRLAHYDYWDDDLRRSILLDSCADLISYGMGEHSIVAIAEALDAGLSIRDITYIDGTVYRTDTLDTVYDAQILPTFEQMQADHSLYARSYAMQYRNSDPVTGQRLVEPYEGQGFIVQNPPAAPLTMQEMDAVYALPYARTYHPSYEKQGGVPAISEVSFSLTSNRGCFGECSFCALTFHQGRIVQARSHESLLNEASALTHQPDFKGYLHDVGGPTADFRRPACSKQLKEGACPQRRCLTPKPCPKLDTDHSDYIRLLRELRALPGMKKVFVRSGIRFDYVLAEHDDTFLRELCEHHISGQLKVAPEHVSDTVLDVMGKPSHEVYTRFARKYAQMNRQLGKKQYLVPYLMSSHPGSTIESAVELAEFCRDMGYNPQQVQDFYPTPSTASTCMYFTGIDPRTMQPVYVPRDPHEKALQRALIQYRNPKNADLVREALRKAGRQDLIGFDSTCLVRPKKYAGAKNDSGGNKGGKRGGTRGETNGIKKTGGTTKNTARTGGTPGGKRAGNGKGEASPSRDAHRNRSRPAKRTRDRGPRR